MLSLLLAQATDTFPDYTATTAADTAAATAAVGIGIGMLIFWFIFGALGLILFIWALIDVLRRNFTNPNDKIMWIILILLIGVIGPILYLIIGRKKGTIPGGTSTPAAQ